MIESVSTRIRRAVWNHISHSHGIPLDFLPGPLSVRILPWRYVLAALLSALACSVIWFALDSMPSVARLSLIVFALAIVGWSVLKLPETPVAIAGGLALIGLKATTPRALLRRYG